MNWPLIFLQAATATVMVISLFGLLIPVYPGLTVIWAAALVFGILVGFESAGLGIVADLCHDHHPHDLWQRHR